MKTSIRLTSCPTCHRPLAAVTVDDARVAQWYDIHDNTIHLGEDEHLIWCPGCAIALPAAPAPRRAGDPAPEEFNPWEERAADYAARPLDYRGMQ